MKYYALQVVTLIACLLALNAFANEPESCVTCHTKAVTDWLQSDHAKAMSIANADTVLGDFDGSDVSHFTQKAKFYRENDLFKVDLSENNKTTSYTIAYTFGHSPLQQYLVAAENGRFQVFPFAWDSRVKDQGGQRWYAIYDQEDMQATDRSHWQQPLQNWNGMCADCHSDGFKRNYKVEDNTFHSDWDNINVSCQSCHGKMGSHAKGAEKKATLGWVFENDSTIASWQGEPRNNQFMETCFSCHSLRAPLNDGIDPDTRFLDQFSPTFLTPDLYYADGQIKEEVYVWGSFLQSKMYAAGVNCLDCHDAHTMQVKTQSNDLCLQCHQAGSYQTEKHTFHPLDSEAGQCVNCHMPETRFMGVDDRRDHSFVIPKPHLAEKYNTPNACTNCHQAREDKWAAQTIKQWFGARETLEPGEQLFLQLQHNRGLPLEQHFALINDRTVSAIRRATAVSMLPLSTQQLADKQIRDLIRSNEPLIRLAVARIGFLLSRDERAKNYVALLQDDYKSIRAAAANQLVGFGLESTAGFEKAIEELTLTNSMINWRAEGNLNLSEIYLKQGKLKKSIEVLQHAITVDPYFDVSYINLLDVYRQLGQIENEVATYQAGLKAVPNSSMLHYVKGLSLIRAGYKERSIASFATAVELDKSNPQFAYLYFLALHGTGKTQLALAELRATIGRYSRNNRLAEIGLDFAKQLQSKADIQFFEHYLKR